MQPEERQKDLAKVEWQFDTSDGVQTDVAVFRNNDAIAKSNSLHGYDSWNLGAETASIATVSCKGCIDGVKKESM